MRPKRPRDTNQLAKFIVDLAVGNAHEEPRQKIAPARRTVKNRKDGRSRPSR